MTLEEPSITPAQVKAARALLGWSQRDLATHAKVAVSTVADFERGQRVPMPNNIDAIRQAIEAGGVRLAAGGAVVGSLPAHTSPSSLKGQPIRWIDATDLGQWGERRDGQDAMPELLSRLIRAEVGHAARLRFPSGDSVMFSGWDGICEVASGTANLPAGRSAWEIGTQRQRIAEKASEDLDKRTKATPAPDRTGTTFVFVTTRRWPAKDKWLKERRGKGDWREVLVLDADDLVHWIELHAAVGYWLAARIGKRPPGLMPLDEAWEEWSRSTKWPMSADLVLAGRDEEAAELLKWLRASPSVSSVQAESLDEAVAFLHAAIEQLPPEYRAPYHARTLIASSPETARMLGDGPSPLIIVLTNGDAGLAERLASKGHHVFAAFGSEVGVPERLIRLPRPRRLAIEAALIGMGMPEADAERFARDCGRSLAALRRLVPAAAGRAAPAWSQAPTARQLIPAMLAGAWQENNESDCQALSRLANKDYAVMAEALAPWNSALDSPLRRVADAWKVASPLDMWFRLAPFVRDADLEAFTDVAFETLTTEVAGETRTLADWVRGAAPAATRPSELLRSGIAESLVTLAVHGKRASAVSDAERRAEALVQRLLDGADERRWLALARLLRDLAEAAPDTFLSALDDALARPEPPVMALFEEHGSNHSDLLWALKTLAWNPDYFARAAGVLSVLARLDRGGRYTNRPKEALRSIFLLWNPQTATPLDQRLKVLNSLRKREPGSAWDLMLDLMPRGHDSVTPSPRPRWRDFPTEAKEIVTYGLIGRGTAAIMDWLLEDAGTSPERWLSIIDLLSDIEPDKRAAARKGLTDVLACMNDGADRARIRKALRQLLYRHRELPDAGWSLPEPELAPIEAIYRQLTPDDPADEVEWLFADPFPNMPDPSPNGDYQAGQVRAAGLRRQAVERIFATDGIEGVLRLFRPTVLVNLIGRALGEAAVPFAAKHEAAARALLETGDRGADFVFGLLADSGADVASLPEALAERARRDGWPQAAVVRLLLAMQARREAWALAREFGSGVEAEYWARMPPFFARDDDADDVAYAVRHLLDAGRAREALSVVGRAPSKFEADLLVEVLLTAARAPVPKHAHANDHTMFDWYVQQALEQLDKVGVPEEQLARVELAYLPMLNLARHYPHGRPPKVVYKMLAGHPKMFVEVVCMLYRPSEGSGIVEERDPSDMAASARARNAWDLLHHFDHVPGTQPGGVDGQKLETWVAEVRRLCAKVGRTEVGDQQIGQVLAHAPADPDGVWPHAAVRDVIEISRSRDLEIGVLIGCRNAKGATSRGPEDGGEQERDLAAQYRAWSKATAFEWPRTSALLERLARDYEADGRWHDDRRESDDWRY